MRSLLSSDPFAEFVAPTRTFGPPCPTWPAKWIRPAFAITPPALVLFRRTFRLDSPARLRLHISAGERFELYCDGNFVGRGPDFGDQQNWYYHSYDLDLSAGEHTLVARVMMFGGRGPSAQISLDRGLIVAADPGSPLQDQINTGSAKWQCKPLTGFTVSEHAWYDQAFGSVTLSTAEWDWNWKRGTGEGWTEAVPGGAALMASTANSMGMHDHLLRPAVLPDQYSAPILLPKPRHVAAIADFASNAEPFAPSSNLGPDARTPITIPANTTRRFLFDLAEYYCFFYRLNISGGRNAKLRISAAEGLYAKPGERYSSVDKRHRDIIDDMYWIGLSDTFTLDGGANRDLESLWWRCGKFVQLVVSTDDEPLTINEIQLIETRYPLELQSHFASSDKRLESLIPMCFRTLQACCHEIFMDCPYYEQQQWVGDMRVQILCHYVSTADSRPAQKALDLIGGSHAITGLTAAFYPSAHRLIIPGFSLWYIACVYDLALWRGEIGLIRKLMPAVRTNMDSILRHMTRDGLLYWPQGWSYTDWAGGWQDGNPPASQTPEGRVESIFNLQAVLVLQMLAELEAYMNEQEQADRWRRIADELFERCVAAFWDERRGLFAVDLEHKHFCEHSQCMAVMTGRLSPEEQSRIAEGLLNDSSLTRAQIFYSYYLFETYRQLGRMDALLKHMDIWHRIAAQGLETTPETYPDSRSDCHAWAAHPLYHYFASILGIRPGSMGFGSVDIRPQLGSLTHASGEMIHPKGMIKAEFRAKGDRLTGRVTLPAGLTGTILLNGRLETLHEGEQEIG